MAIAPDPVKVVLDCSTGASLQASVAGLLDQAAEAARAGDAEQVANLLALANERTEAAASQPAAVTVVTLADDELEQHALDQAANAAALVADVERAWVELRMKRDRWLAQTDAFFVDPLPSDFPADKVKDISVNVDAWKAFRQALRDLPANTADPSNPSWPKVPPAPVVYLT